MVQEHSDLAARLRPRKGNLRAAIGRRIENNEGVPQGPRPPCRGPRTPEVIPEKSGVGIPQSLAPPDKGAEEHRAEEHRRSCGVAVRLWGTMEQGYKAARRRNAGAIRTTLRRAG